MNGLQVEDLTVRFPARRGVGDALRRRPPAAAVAVDGVALEVGRGEILGIVGESGCGKTTLARCIAGMQQPTTGSVSLDGISLPGAGRSRAACRSVQMVFQDPYSSLNPRMTLYETLAELLAVHGLCPREQRMPRAIELLELVGLDPSLLHARPRSLSGGQRQRASIARALALEPDVLVADEPVSALDVSVQAVVLNLLSDLRARLGTTIVLISHDLAVVSHLCDRVAVMYLGRIVEQGRASDLFSAPQHPYTRALLGTVPSGTPLAGERPVLPGEPPSPYAIPDGCRFRSRCPVAIPRCAIDDPALKATTHGALAACHLASRPKDNMSASPTAPATDHRGGHA
jgi:oligopeptide/dipeptide ABC transporter ATP-binding protein